jgi:starch synthase (maltosyl-transferring)
LSTLPRPEPVDAADGRVRVVIEGSARRSTAAALPSSGSSAIWWSVEADCFADGHDVVACSLLWRRAGEPGWQQHAHAPLGNDRWRASVRRRCARQLVLHGAGLGRPLPVVAARFRPARSISTTAHRRADRRGADRAGRAARRARQRRRPAASLGAGPAARGARWWSASARASPAGTSSFRDRPRPTWAPRQLRRLRGLAALRRRHGLRRALPAADPSDRPHQRKGRNNTLVAGPTIRQPVGDRRGRGRAQASTGAGHARRLPRLLVQRAGSTASRSRSTSPSSARPTIPTSREHPEWFRTARRQHPVRREPAQEVPGHLSVRLRDRGLAALWRNWRDVFEFWMRRACASSASTTRTPSLPFWEWAIAEIRAASRDVIFLSEAFTRPKVMHRLAKLGFSQSYTYFTWRNTKQELTEYFTELTQRPGTRLLPAQRLAEHARHPARALQYGGRAGVHVAADAGGHAGANYGIYGPAFELLEAAPREPAARNTSTRRSTSCAAWDLRRPDSRWRSSSRAQPIRRDNPALQSTRLRFHPIDNEQMIAYAKTTPDGSTSSSAWSTSTRTTCSRLARPRPGGTGLGARAGLPDARPADRRARFLWQGRATTSASTRSAARRT